jgi:signal transduction histidine kinase
VKDQDGLMPPESAVHATERLEQPAHGASFPDEMTKQDSRRAERQQNLCAAEPSKSGQNAFKGFMGSTKRSTSPGRSVGLLPRRAAKPARVRPKDGVERARRLLRVDEEERRRLSLALHRNVTQSLAALSTNLDLIEQQATLVGSRTRGLLLTSRQIVRDCFRQIRLLTDQLSPPLVAELGLELAVRCVVASFTERTGITVACDVDDCPRLPDDVELTLLRVIEDCLENLDPLVQMSSIALAAVKDTVELRVRPVRAAVAARWQHRVFLQFGTAVDVRMLTLPAHEAGGSPSARVGLIVTTTRIPPSRL